MEKANGVREQVLTEYNTDAKSELVYRHKIEAKRHIVELETFVFRSLTQDELPGWQA
jgi:hypothetical protein